MNSIGEAYTAYTPTITASSGTFTTVSGAGYWTQVNKVVFGYVTIAITNNGTASGAVLFTLPTATRNTYTGGSSIGFGREGASTGNALNVDWRSITGGAITNYNNAYPGASGYSLRINFIYEAA